MKRATLLATGDFITCKELGEELNNATKEQISTPNLVLKNEEDEKQRILQALHQTRNNKTRAAQLLGIDRKTLYNKLKLYNIPQ